MCLVGVFASSSQNELLILARPGLLVVYSALYVTKRVVPAALSLLLFPQHEAYRN